MNKARYLLFAVRQRQLADIVHTAVLYKVAAKAVFVHLRELFIGFVRLLHLKAVKLARRGYLYFIGQKEILIVTLLLYVPAKLCIVSIKLSDVHLFGICVSRTFGRSRARAKVLCSA